MPLMTHAQTLIQLSIGQLQAAQVDLLFENLPLDISFIDEHDKVRYFNRSKCRIFKRDPEALGRDVRLCHPPQSLHKVEEILEAFRLGKHQEAAFWFTYKERQIHVRYIALYDEQKKYKGVLEIGQDLSELRQLEGERKLVAWK